MALTRVGSKGIAVGAIDPNDIAANAITEAKIASNAVESRQIAADSVVEAKIADSAVTPNKISGQVPVSKGGTGVASLTADAILIGNGTSAINTIPAGDSGNVLTSSGTAWISKAISAGGNLVTSIFTSPGTWDANVKIAAGLKAIKVTVVGGGGAGQFAPATASSGSTSSFGAFASATGGAAGSGSIGPPTSATITGGIGGVGSGGDINIAGGSASSDSLQFFDSGAGFFASSSGQKGGDSILGAGGGSPGGRLAINSGFGGGGGAGPRGNFVSGGGAGGASIRYIQVSSIPGPVNVTVGLGGAKQPAPTLPAPIGPLIQVGANGIVVVEEFY